METERKVLLFRDSYTDAQAKGLGIQLGYYAWSADRDGIKRALMHILDHCEKVISSVLRECFDPEHILRVGPEILKSIICKKLDSSNGAMIMRTFKKLDFSTFYQLRGLIYFCCRKMCICRNEQSRFVIRELPELLLRLLDLPELTELTEQEHTDFLSLFDLAYQHSAITTNDLLKKMQK